MQFVPGSPSLPLADDGELICRVRMIFLSGPTGRSDIDGLDIDPGISEPGNKDIESMTLLQISKLHVLLRLRGQSSNASAPVFFRSLLISFRLIV